MERVGLLHWRNTKALIVPFLGASLSHANQYSWRRVHNFIHALLAEDMHAKKVATFNPELTRILGRWRVR
jgi:hypothetical protein